MFLNVEWKLSPGWWSLQMPRNNKDIASVCSMLAATYQCICKSSSLCPLEKRNREAPKQLNARIVACWDDYLRKSGATTCHVHQWPCCIILYVGWAVLEVSVIQSLSEKGKKTRRFLVKADIYLHMYEQETSNIYFPSILLDFKGSLYRSSDVICIFLPVSILFHS